MLFTWRKTLKKVLSILIKKMCRYSQIFLIFVDIKQSEDMWMFYQFHNCYLSLHLKDKCLSIFKFVFSLNNYVNKDFFPQKLLDFFVRLHFANKRPTKGFHSKPNIMYWKPFKTGVCFTLKEDFLSLHHRFAGILWNAFKFKF